MPFKMRDELFIHPQISSSLGWRGWISYFMPHFITNVNDTSWCNSSINEKESRLRLWNMVVQSTLYKKLFKNINIERREITSKHRFDILDSFSSFFLYFDIGNYMSWYIISFMAWSLLLKYSLFIFSSTPVLTSSIDVVFVLSIG